MSDPLYAFPLFRFQVDFLRAPVVGLSDSGDVPLCRGAFSEVTGLEATMEPKVIKSGGSNYGPAQRPGQVSFGTVILKRGITSSRDLWKWFSLVNERAKFAFRLNVVIKVLGESKPIAAPGDPEADATPSADPQYTIRLWRALPVKFKAGDLNAKVTEVGIEEIHLAHEGLSFE